jgi:hypothetical protein
MGDLVGKCGLAGRADRAGMDGFADMDGLGYVVEHDAMMLGLTVPQMTLSLDL